MTRFSTGNKLIMGALLTACMTLPAQAADIKIGVVNPTRLLEEAPQAKKALSELEGEFEARDKELMTEQKAVKSMEDKLARDGAIMSESERRKSEREVVSRKRELRRALDELREDRTFRGNEERGKLLRYVNEAITAVGKEEDFDLILYEGIAFVKPDVDLTNKILERLKKEAAAGKAIGK